MFYTGRAQFNSLTMLACHLPVGTLNLTTLSMFFSVSTGLNKASYIESRASKQQKALTQCFCKHVIFSFHSDFQATCKNKFSHFL